QKKVIPEALKGRGIIGQSHTGSGKTHSFLLPILNAINSGKNQVQAVITAPTRELARQLYNEAEKLIKYADKEDEWKIQLLIGGTERSRDKQRLRNIPQIIVGTPHRIYAMIDEGSLSIYEAT